MKRSSTKRPCTATRPVSVLLCSNDRTLADLVAWNLDQRNFTVYRAPLNQTDGPVLPPGVAVDLLLVDSDDDVWDVWHHVAQLRVLFPYVPLVVLAHAAPSVQQLGQLQPGRFVQKPFAIDRLLAACDAARCATR
jgi:DNA-binding response OmpR family regulator